MSFLDSSRASENRPDYAASGLGSGSGSAVDLNGGLVSQTLGAAYSRIRHSVAKGVVTLFATLLLQRLADGNRAQRARFPAPGADSSSQFHITMPHRVHYGCKVAGSHQNSRPVVMSRTVKNQFLRKARFVARLSEEIA